MKMKVQSLHHPCIPCFCQCGLLHICDSLAQSAGCLISLIGSDAFLYSSILGMSGLWSEFRSNLINHFLNKTCTLDFHD